MQININDTYTTGIHNKTFDAFECMFMDQNWAITTSRCWKKKTPHPQPILTGPKSSAANNQAHSKLQVKHEYFPF